MPTIKNPIPEAAIVRAHCDAIAAHAAVLKTVITGDPTSDTAATAISAIRHSLDELEAYAEQRRLPHRTQAAHLTRKESPCPHG